MYDQSIKIDPNYVIAYIMKGLTINIITINRKIAWSFIKIPISNWDLWSGNQNKT